MTTPEWEARVAAAWATFDERSDGDNRALIESLAAELPPDSAIASFERACVFDSTDASDLAVPLYQDALARGLPEGRRRRAVIQLASSLRNVGRAEESVVLLTEELEAPSDELVALLRTLDYEHYAFRRRVLVPDAIGDPNTFFITPDRLDQFDPAVRHATTPR